MISRDGSSKHVILSLSKLKATVTLQRKTGFRIIPLRKPLVENRNPRTNLTDEEPMKLELKNLGLAEVVYFVHQHAQGDYVHLVIWCPSGRTSSPNTKLAIEANGEI